LRYDHVIIGSGINALVCAAMLSRTKKVLVVEREAVAGGCMRSDELAPGFTYDPLAATFVLFVASAAYGELAGDLARAGVSFANTDTPTGALRTDGRHSILSTGRAANIAALGGDGARHAAEMAAVERDAELLFGLLGAPLWSRDTARLLGKSALRRGPREVAGVLGDALMTARTRLAGFGPDAEALHAPWSLHAGLAPEQPFSGKIGQVIAFALEAFGAPMAVGGAGRVAEGLVRIIEGRRAGIRRSEVRLGVEADEILPGSDGRSVAGLRLADGTVIDTPSVICSVTPNQLYGRLLRNWTVPEWVPDAVARYQYGRGNMQIHYALERPVDWPDPALGRVQLLHLSDGVDQVSKATNEADCGMLPERPTVCVGQPTAADPSRAPAGKAVLWVQLPEAPRVLKGDAAGTIETPADGRWTEAVREAYADRVEAMIAAHDPSFRETVIARRALSPADLERMNVNLVGGDPYGGGCGLDQFFLFRPFPRQVNHRTAVRDVFHIGASTHPGAGLGGTSGYLVAKALQ
jgi:phytoene dehydrogenase-like protein